jgi:DoxX-like family
MLNRKEREMMMQTNSATWRSASASVWTGRAMSGAFVLFMLGASVVPKFFLPDVSHAAMTELGWPVKYTMLIGGIELAGTLLYVWPRTAVLGAVILMGLLGGAMATQIRVENPLFSHELFSLYLGLLMWGGLWLRDERLRAIFPVRKG